MEPYSLTRKAVIFSAVGLFLAFLNCCQTPKKNSIDILVWTNSASDQMAVREDFLGGILILNKKEREWSFDHKQNGEVFAHVSEFKNPIKVEAGVLLVLDTKPSTKPSKYPRRYEIKKEVFLQIAEAIKESGLERPIGEIVVEILGE